MMTACRFSQFLARYHDGELDESLRADVEAHLLTCASCTEELSELQDVSDLVNGASAPGASPELMARLDKTADRLDRIRFARWARRTAALAAALLVTAVLARVLVSRESPKPAPQPVSRTLPRVDKKTPSTSSGVATVSDDDDEDP